jgi:hypothetical protein
MTRGKEILCDCQRLLRRCGATGIEHRRGGKHVHLLWNYRGKNGKTVLPSSPSDRRSCLNAIAYLKRQLRSIEVGSK